ncbi:MAG: PP2C family serine/threonine-protein phosphatase [Planctomycetaceae bacterium]
MALLDANLQSSPAIRSNSFVSGHPKPVSVERHMAPSQSVEAKAQQTLFLKSSMDEAQAVSCANGTALAFSRPSPAKETPNEDAAAVFDLWAGTAVLVVADGVGGMKAGHKASSSAIRAIKRSLKKAKEGSDLRSFILDGIERANENILRNAAGSATTVAIVEICDGFMRPYHVGDSIILQIGNRGQIKWSALSHAPLSYAVEAGVISEANAMVHPDRNLISNVVGDREMRIEIGPRRKLAKSDTIVVASDGLCDNLSTLEIADFTRRSPLPERVQQMIAETRNRMYLAIDGRSELENLPGKPDDLTLVVYRRDKETKRTPAEPVVKPPQVVIDRVQPIVETPGSLVVDYQ